MVVLRTLEQLKDICDWLDDNVDSGKRDAAWETLHKRVLALPESRVMDVSHLKADGRGAREMASTGVGPKYTKHATLRLVWKGTGKVELYMEKTKA